MRSKNFERSRYLLQSGDCCRWNTFLSTPPTVEVRVPSDRPLLHTLLPRRLDLNNRVGTLVDPWYISEQGRPMTVRVGTFLSEVGKKKKVLPTALTSIQVNGCGGFRNSLDGEG